MAKHTKVGFSYDRLHIRDILVKVFLPQLGLQRLNIFIVDKSVGPYMKR